MKLAALVKFMTASSHGSRTGWPARLWVCPDGSVWCSRLDVSWPEPWDTRAEMANRPEWFELKP